MERVSITLPDPLTRRFYAKIEKGQRSQFIAEALQEALNRMEKWQAFVELKNFSPVKVPENSVKILQKIRQSRRPKSSTKRRSI